MAVRDDFAAGEVLAAADLNDTFAAKPTFTYGTATPTADAEGAIWYDENSTPPVPKFWDGSAWQTFSAGAADFSDAATGTYTDTGVDYKYLTFTASGTLTVTRAGFADVLVVGGGGGGGRCMGGGGGAGGYLQDEVYLDAATHTVIVGAGGVGLASLGNESRPPGAVGEASALGSNFVAVGGGGGGGDGLAGTYGGSSGGGAGGSSSNQPAGSNLSVQGFSGGSGLPFAGAGGGGGGASEVGANATSNNAGGDGGDGLANSLTGTSVTYGGGGGGGSDSGGVGPDTAGAGGAGGGGAGGVGSSGGTAGTANTGGGGGGGGRLNSSSDGFAGGNGGSGIVIVRVRT